MELRTTPNNREMIDDEPTLLEADSWACWPFCSPAGTASADPPDVKTLAIGSPAPDFQLAGRRRQDLHPRGFRPEQGLVHRLHLQSLSDGPGLRRTHRPACIRLSRQGRRGRGDLAQQPQGRPARRARIHRPGRFVRRHENPSERSQLSLIPISTMVKPSRSPRPTA